jgi:acyl-CoA thioester hydrolase
MAARLNLDQEIGVRLPVSEPNFMNEWHEIEVNVRYAETDQMGIVHHANYLVWFELGRTEFCKSKGFSYREMEQNDDALMVVAEVYCRYKSPAFYDDKLTIKTKIVSVKSRTLRFVYEVFRPIDKTLLVEGETMHVFTDKQKRVRTLPEKYKSLLLSESGNMIDRSFPPNEAPH